MSTTSELALIVGGTSGMGRETARLLVAQDIPVWVTGRKTTNVEQAKQALGAGTAGSSLDLSKVDQVQDFIGTIEKETRHIKYLVNAAGTFYPKPFLETTGKDYDQYLDLNKAFFLIYPSRGQEHESPWWRLNREYRLYVGKASYQSHPVLSLFYGQGRAPLTDTEPRNGISRRWHSSQRRFTRGSGYPYLWILY